MTLKEKVRQLLVCNYPGTDINLALSKSDVCGNFVIFTDNVKNLPTAQIQSNNLALHDHDPLTWIMIDQEGGQVTRIKDKSPSPRDMALTNTVPFWGNLHGQTLNNLHIDVNLAPVADTTHLSPIIKNRSFAEDPLQVSAYVDQYLESLQKYGVLAAIKHLPGHGRVLADTHTKAGVLNYTWEELKSFDLLPFISAINHGARILMVGHIIIPELDDKPATISKIIITKLRQYLPHGSEIILLTDSLSMKGVGIPNIDAPIAALQAGEDMLLIQDLPEREVFDKIIAAYQDKTLDISNLDLSVARILKQKQSTPSLSHLPQ